MGQDDAIYKFLIKQIFKMSLYPPPSPLPHTGYMHHPTSFVTPVVEHWLERET